jgi:hypothetical protein
MLMRCDATFKESILLRCYDALEQEGFKRFRKHNVDWLIHDAFHCWTGLNTGLYPDYVEISPFVGIHVVPIEKLHVLKGRRRYDRGIATYAIHMGEIAAASNEPAFMFTREQSDSFIDSEARRLAELYATVGLEYACSIASYEALLPLLQSRLDMLGGYPESVASCLYLMGRVTEARNFVERFLAKEPNYFRDFAQPFLRMIEAEQPNNG